MLLWFDLVTNKYMLRAEVVLIGARCLYNGLVARSHFVSGHQFYQVPIDGAGFRLFLFSTVLVTFSTVQ